MSTDLEQFRDHCRRMSLLGAHVEECHAVVQTRWSGSERVHPDPSCRGCVPDNDRRLFSRLAGEIDQYLTGEEDLPGLFEVWPKTPTNENELQEETR